MTGSCDSLNNYCRRSASILLLAPSHEPPDDSACIDLLTRDPPSETNVVSVTFAESPSERLSIWLREAERDLPARATIIDARRNMTSAERPASKADSIAVRGLSEDADLHDIGLAIASQLGAWKDADETTALCLHSVTGLLATYDADRVISLITALNELCERLGVVAHHHVDPNEHDRETVAMLRPLYDAVIEYASDGGWIPTEREVTTPAPSFRSTTAPPGGTAKTDADRPETVPMRYSFDTILELLSSPRRRTLLYYLKNQSAEEIPLDRLAGKVHDIDRSLPVRGGSSRERIEIQLHQVHLPKLDEAGIIRYDADAKTVHYAANQGLESFLRYIETVELG